MKKDLISFCLLFVIWIPFCLCTAQDEVLNTPEVHPDRTVTFRFYAPDAKEVMIHSQFTEGLQPMELGTLGIWKTRLGPADPEIYVYGFVVDGVEMADPWNRYVLVNEWPSLVAELAPVFL